MALDPKDERLLEEDWETRAGTDRKRSKQHSLGVSWMRRPDYISTEQARYQPTTIEKIESRVGFGIRKKMGNDMGNFMDREAQIEKIEKTFQDVQNEITEHHSKKGIVPEAVFEILPDDELWKFPCAQVIFDADPAPYGVDSKNQLEMMSQAMIRGVMDESGEQFVAYFLPTAETMDKRNRYVLLIRVIEFLRNFEFCN